MKISRIGEAPDYRFSLANERTFLAWIRTALGFLAAGVGLDQLAPDFATPLIREVLALLLCLFAGGLAVYGYLRWLSNADKRRARRENDPGLQPERTSLAWFRTLLGYGALMALAIKHNWHGAGLAFWISIGVLAVVAIVLWRYTRSRHLMDVAESDFLQPGAVRDKFLISLAVLSLSLLFAVTHLRQIILFLKDVT